MVSAGSGDPRRARMHTVILRHRSVVGSLALGAGTLAASETPWQSPRAAAAGGECHDEPVAGFVYNEGYDVVVRQATL